MGFAGGGHERTGLVLAFLVFEFRFAVDDDTGTGRCIVKEVSPGTFVIFCVGHENYSLYIRAAIGLIRC